MFDFAAAIAQRPSGDSTAQLIATYGNPDGAGASGSPQGPAWFTPSPAWKEANLITIPLSRLPGFPPCPYGEIRGVTLHRLVAPVFEATWAAVVRRGLADKLRTFDGAVAFRRMGTNRSRPLSVHAFGAAVDFDARWNGYGVPQDRMQINREVVRTFQECGWEWGGAWSSPWEDGMHFQWTNPLSGVPQPAWRDAMAQRTPAPAPVLATPAVQAHQLYVPLRNPDGTPRSDAVSITVDGSGVLLVGQDRKPRAYYMDSALAASKGVK